MSGERDCAFIERMRLHELMWQHVLTLPISERHAWIEPLSVVRHGRFLTAEEKLANLARAMDMTPNLLAQAISRVDVNDIPEV